MNSKVVKRRIKAKIFWRTWRYFIVAVITISAIPLIIGLIDKCQFPDLISIPPGEVLAYFGSAIGLFSVSFTISVKIEKKSTNNEVRKLPVMSVKVSKSNGNAFNIECVNLSRFNLENIYLFDKEVVKSLEPAQSFTYKVFLNYYQTIDEENSMSYNDEPDILVNGSPAYIQICCDNGADNNFWSFIYRQNKKDDHYYILSESTLI